MGCPDFNPMCGCACCHAAITRAPHTHEHSPKTASDNPAASVSSGATCAAHEANPRIAPPTIYVAGPYRASSAWQVEQNIRVAEEYGYAIAKLGAYPVIPHSNTRAYFESAQEDPAFWLEGTLELMRGCRALFMLPQWPMSTGARGEHAEALRLGKPIFEDLSACGDWIRRFKAQRAEQLNVLREVTR